MNQGLIRYISIVALTFSAVACSPSDETVGKNVKERLTADPVAKTAQIDVGVQKKVVTLTGTADTSEAKEKAVAAARTANGVAEVVDQITVNGHGPGAGHGPGPGHEMMGKGMSEGMNRPAEEVRK